jgi:hypothetical protein
MLRFVNNKHESPSSVMRTNSQTRNDSGSVYASTHDTTSRPTPDRVFQNSEGQRIDIPTELHVNPSLAHSMRDRRQRFCNAHYLLRDCFQASCQYDHDTELSEREFEALLYLSRSQRCPQDSNCTSSKCTRGHMCPNGTTCRFGDECKFANLHGIDTIVAKEVMG